MAYEIIDRQVMWPSGEGEHERLELSIDTLMTREQPHFLSTAFDYWNSLGARPTVDAFNLWERFETHPSLSFCGMIEIGGLSPENFLFERHAAPSKGKFFDGLNGTRLSDFPDAMHVNTLAQDYSMAAIQARPKYQEVRHDSNGFYRRYCRLLLPLFGADGCVQKLAYATRRLEAPSYPSLSRLPRELDPR